MAEYIEREAIAKLFDSECRGECVVCPHDDRGDCTLINQIPTADVQPVKHGHWIIRDRKRYLISCSNCNWINVHGKFDYCPICGAKMDGEDNG